MRRRASGLIAAGVLAAAAAATAFFAASARTPRPAPGEREVLVAARDIPEGAALSPAMLAAARLPAEYAAPDAYEWARASDTPDGKARRWLEREDACPDCADRFMAAEDMTARIPIPKGSQVTRHALHHMDHVYWGTRRRFEEFAAHSPAPGHPVSDIPDDYVGGELPLESPLFGLVEPGDRVDVLATFEAELDSKSKRAPKSQKATATLLQDIQVLAKSAPPAGPKCLLLRLNPAEAQALMTARHQGAVTVILRNPSDHTMRPMAMVNFWSAWGRR